MVITSFHSLSLPVVGHGCFSQDLASVHSALVLAKVFVCCVCVCVRRQQFRITAHEYFSSQFLINIKIRQLIEPNIHPRLPIALWY